LTALERRIEIRWSDLDASRHVNNAVYLSYLEEARTELLERLLGGRDEALEFALVHVGIDFRRELTLDDVAVLVRCAVERLGTSSVRTLEQVQTQDGEVAADAEAVVVARDPATGGSRPLTDAERAALTQA
jgi:acyl-CoA thioester hydrolase